MATRNMRIVVCDICGSDVDVRRVNLIVANRRASGDLCGAHREPVEELLGRLRTAPAKRTLAQIPVVSMDEVARRARKGTQTARGGTKRGGQVQPDPGGIPGPEKGKDT